jgi:hypothetical protein
MSLISLLNPTDQYEETSACEEGCVDCHLRGSCEDDDVPSLEHLREVKLSGFSGQEHYCLDMVHLLLMSASALERMILTSKTSLDFEWLPELMLVESMESILPRSRGKWTARRAANAAVTTEYEWTPDR